MEFKDTYIGSDEISSEGNRVVREKYRHTTSVKIQGMHLFALYIVSFFTLLLLLGVIFIFIGLPRTEYLGIFKDLFADTLIGGFPNWIRSIFIDLFTVPPVSDGRSVVLWGPLLIVGLGLYWFYIIGFGRNSLSSSRNMFIQYIYYLFVVTIVTTSFDFLDILLSIVWILITYFAIFPILDKKNWTIEKDYQF